MKDDHFHQQTFAIVGYTPARLAYAQAILTNIEIVYHITLPTAVRTWFSYADVSVLIEQYSPDGHSALAMENYLDLTLGEPHRILHTLLTQGWFAFAVECQGCGYWAIPVNTSSDPPVVFISDYDTPTPQTIELRSNAFSSFITQWFFDGATFIKPHDWTASSSFGFCTAWSETEHCNATDIGVLEQRGIQFHQQQDLYRADRSTSVLIIENDIFHQRARWYLIARVATELRDPDIAQQIQTLSNNFLNKDELVQYFLREPMGHVAG